MEDEPADSAAVPIREPADRIGLNTLRSHRYGRPVKDNVLCHFSDKTPVVKTQSGPSLDGIT